MYYAYNNEWKGYYGLFLLFYFRRFRLSPLLFRKVLRRTGAAYPNSVDEVNKVGNWPSHKLVQRAEGTKEFEITEISKKPLSQVKFSQRV